jgi:hypothetical protein
LPATGIAAEKADIATLGDERLQIVAHRRGPIFIVADAQNELVGWEDFRPKFQIAVYRVFQAVSVRLGPGDKRLLPSVKL